MAIGNIRLSHALPAVPALQTGALFAICVTAMLLLVACVFALPAFAAALSLLRTQGLARFFSQLLRRRQS